MFNGNAFYFAFGLEGVNNDTGFNTREDLLGAALHWAWDTATASIEAKPMPNGQVSYFTAEMDSTFGGDGVTYRWDFGDGTPFTTVYTSATAGHTYAEPGTYTVRVEATNGLDTRVIGETTDDRAGGVQHAGVRRPSRRMGDTYLHSGEPMVNYGASPFLHTRVARRVLTTCVRCWPSMYRASQLVTL